MKRKDEQQLSIFDLEEMQPRNSEEIKQEIPNTIDTTTPDELTIGVPNLANQEVPEEIKEECPQEQEIPIDPGTEKE